MEYNDNPQFADTTPINRLDPAIRYSHRNPGTNYTYPGRNPFQPPRHAVSQERSWTVRRRTRRAIMKDFFKVHTGGIIAGFTVTLAIIGALILFVGLSKTSTSSITLVNQPPTASQVAKSLNCTKFKDTGPAQAGGAVDTGYCFIGKQKYAIDTFASKDVRDAWLKMAQPLGVNPKWMSDTSVTYPSVKNS